MGKTVFIGAATAKPQITTIAIGGTWGDTETVTLKIAEKEVVYTCSGTPTAATVAAGLMALAEASDDPEFAEVDTWTLNTSTITATGAKRYPDNNHRLRGFGFRLDHHQHAAGCHRSISLGQRRQLEHRRSPRKQR